MVHFLLSIININAKTWKFKNAKLFPPEAPETGRRVVVASGRAVAGSDGLGESTVTEARRSSGGVDIAYTVRLLHTPHQPILPCLINNSLPPTTSTENTRRMHIISGQSLFNVM